MLIGNLAVRFHMLSPEQLQQALSEQSGEQQPIGQHLLKMGLITESQLEFLLSAQEMKALRISDVKFGKIAVDNGFVTEEQVEAALDRQKAHYLQYEKKTLIGDILVTNHLMTETQKQSVIEEQQRIIKAHKEKSEAAFEAELEGPIDAAEGG